MTTNAERVHHRDEVVAAIEAAFVELDAQPLLSRLAVAGIPAGRVRSLDEVYAWDQTRSQGLLVDVEHATLGTITLPGPPLRFFDVDGAEVTKRAHAAPPVLDADGASVRQWLAQAVPEPRTEDDQPLHGKHRP
jgi:crotonobetainyl-CoA:carnitine CoA-transferase CaiB-like acyl-CoA transferase